MNEYTGWLIYLAILGVLLWIFGRTYGERSKSSVTIYELAEVGFAVIVCIWAAIFQIAWERKSYFYAVKFGTVNTKEHELERENFKGVLKKNPITGKLEKVYPGNQRVFKFVITYCTTFFMIGVVIALTFSLFLYRAILVQSEAHGWGPMVVATLNTIQIALMNLVYDALALKLNEWENHRTQSDYENSLIIKKVGYQFVNYYISLFYVAFVKEHFEGCDKGDCMGELNYNLWVFFLLNMIFNVIELATPIITAKTNLKNEEIKVQKMAREGKLARVEMSFTEYQGKLSKIVLLNEYLELAMNYGYIIFFAVAFPLGPVIYWLYNILEMKADAYKFLHLSKRPTPESASDIGVWTDVMNFLSLTAVITNVGIIVFTANVFDLPAETRWWVFIIIEHSILLAMILILNYFPLVTPCNI